MIQAGGLDTSQEWGSQRLRPKGGKLIADGDASKSKPLHLNPPLPGPDLTGAQGGEQYWWKDTQWFNSEGGVAATGEQAKCSCHNTIKASTEYCKYFVWSCYFNEWRGSTRCACSGSDCPCLHNCRVCSTGTSNNFLQTQCKFSAANSPSTFSLLKHRNSLTTMFLMSRIVLPMLGWYQFNHRMSHNSRILLSSVKVMWGHQSHHWWQI